MSRFRLRPTAAQERALEMHCAHARFVWNLAVEQHSWWAPHRSPAPGFAAQCRQLTEARAEFPWLAAGSGIVQQQALRDFSQAVSRFISGTHRRPTWRKAGPHESFRIVGFSAPDVRRLSRKVGEVRIPKVGWVRFRWSRPIPGDVRSYRVKRDGAGRWHVAFAAIPRPVPAPGNGRHVGVDRGVVVSAALSTGELLNVPGLRVPEARRMRRLLRRLARTKPGSRRRRSVRLQIARLRARERDRRTDWVEKTSTYLAGSFDLIGVEALNISAMTRSAKGTAERPGSGVSAKAGLNRGILASGWGLLVSRLEDKAPGRVVSVPAAYTSQTCSVCGHAASESRESQARFRCVACGHTDHADVNAAENINTAAGRAVAAREGRRNSAPVHREPHLATSLR